MSTDKKSFTSAKRHRISEIKETYDHVPRKAMVVKLGFWERRRLRRRFIRLPTDSSSRVCAPCAIHHQRPTTQRSS
jgi:hypothetical protein